MAIKQDQYGFPVMTGQAATDVACPTCGAPRDEHCTFSDEERAAGLTPISHTARWDLVTVHE